MYHLGEPRVLPRPTPPTRSAALATRAASPRERWIALGVSAAVVVGYLVIAGIHGALGIPRNDDWTYYRLAFETGHEGLFAPDPFTRTMLIGQILLAHPVVALFGDSIMALQVFGAVFAVVGLWATYLVVRHFLPSGWAAFSVGCLAFGPIYGSLAPTFLSDVPSFAVQSLALLAGVQALTRTSRRILWLALSLALSFVAFSIREYSVAAALAVVGCFVLCNGGARPHIDPRRARRERVGGILLGVVWLGFAALLYVWRSGLAPAAGPHRLHVLAMAKLTVWLGATCALLVAPAALLLWRRIRTWSVTEWVSLAGAFALALTVFVKWRAKIPIGNYVTQSGSYPETLSGPHPTLLPSAVWTILLVVCYASCLTLVAHGLMALLHWAVERIGPLRASRAADGGWKPAGRARPRPAAYGLMRQEPVVVLSVAYGLTTLLVVLGVTALVPSVTDRYLVPAVPFLAAGLVWVSRRSTTYRRRLSPRAAGILGLVALAAFGIYQVDSTATFDGAKWRMGETLVRAGYAPATVDAGYEWFGFHQPGPIRPLSERVPGYGFWVRIFDSPRVCAQVRYASPAGPAAHHTVLAATTTKGLFGARFDLVATKASLRC